MTQVVEVTQGNETFEVEFPSDMRQEDIDAIIQRDFFSVEPPPAQDIQPPVPEVDSTVTEEFRRGFNRLGVDFAAFAQSFADPEEAALEALRKQEVLSQQLGKPASLTDVIDAYKNEGVIDAAGEVLGAIPRITAAQVPQSALTLAATGAGTILGGPAVGLGLGFASLGPQLYSQMLQRQAQADLEAGREVDVDPAKAAAAAAAATVAEQAATYLGLGKGLLSRLFGRTPTSSGLVNLAKDTLKGVARGAAVEMPTEFAQTVIERAQADLDLLSDEAIAEYGEVLYMAGIAGGTIGGVSGAIDPVFGAAQPGQIATPDLSETVAQPGQPGTEITDDISEESPTPDVSPTPQVDVEERLNEIRPKLLGTLKGRGLDDIGIELSARISPRGLEGMRDPEGVRASYDPAVKTIFLGADRIRNFGDLDSDQLQREFGGLVDHEMVHAVKRMKLWTDSEWRVLENAARKKRNSVGQTFLEAAKSTYDQESADIQMEEAIAELMRETLAGRTGLAGQPLSLMRRVIEFFRKLGNTITGTGYASFNQVINDVETGVLGGRPREEVSQQAETTIMPSDALLASRDSGDRVFSTRSDSAGMSPDTARKLRSPDYYRQSRGIVSRIERMSPSDYVARVSKDAFPTFSEAEVRAQREERGAIKEIAQAMESGTVFGLPTIEYGVPNRSGVAVQEGLNRAMAAESLGIQEIPVAIFERADLLASRQKTDAQAQSVMNLEGGMTAEEVAVDAERRQARERQRKAAEIGLAEARAILDTSPTKLASRDLEAFQIDPELLSPSQRRLLGLIGTTPERLARARQQGFDTDRVLYHGTNRDLTALDPDATSDAFGNPKNTRAIFLTDNPDVSATYGAPNPDLDINQALYPVFAKTDRPIVINAAGENYQGLKRNSTIKLPSVDGPVSLSLNRFIQMTESDTGGQEVYSTDEVLDGLIYAIDQGDFSNPQSKFGVLGIIQPDSIIFENIIDRGMVQPKTQEALRRSLMPSTVIAVLNGENIRSVNAEFGEGVSRLSKELLASRESLPLTSQEAELSARSILESGGRYDDSTAKLTTRPFAELLDERVQRIFGRKLDEETAENKDIISNVMVDEALSELESEGNAVGWYKKTIEDMMTTFEQMYPVESQNPDNVDTFKFILAITSNGASVPENTRNALSVFDEYLQSGTVPTRGFGKEANAMKKSFDFFNALVDKLGTPSKVFELLGKTATAKQIEQDTGKKISGENVNTVLPYSAIFGPKIGIFYQNLNGNWDFLTMDRWFMKTWGRYTGTNTPDFNKAFPARAKTLREEIKNLPRLKGYRKDRLMRDNDELMRFAEEKHRAYERGGFKDRSEINKKSKNLYEAVSGVKVAPSTGSERVWIRDVTNDAVNKLQDRGVDIDAATLQALLWYAEKKIYGNHGITNKKSEPTDYATEINRIAESRGRLASRSPADDSRRSASRLGSARREGQLGVNSQIRPQSGDFAGLAELQDKSAVAADMSKATEDREDSLLADQAASEEIRNVQKLASRAPVSDIVEATAYNRAADLASKRAARGQGTVDNPLPFEAPSGGKADGFIFAVQDKYIDLKNAVESIKERQRARGLTPLLDTENPYLGEESMHGIIGNKFNRFEQDEITPLAKKLVNNKIDRRELEEFLVLRHAIERNANIRKLNAASKNPRLDLQDGGAGSLNGKRLLDRYVKDEMSKRYNLDWDDSTGSWTGGNRRANIMNDLAADFDRITNGTLEELRDSGLISQESFNILKNHYKYYAPLRGVSPDEDIAIEEHARMSKGANNLSISGIETERAKGRTSEAMPPLGQIIMQRQNAIRRGTINDVVGQRMLNLVRENPNDSYWKIHDDPKFAQISSKELFGVKEDGRQYYIEFKDDRLRQAMMSLDAAQTGKILGFLRGVNRYMSSVLTSYNPDFIIPNFFRDLGTAVGNLVGEQTMVGGKAVDTDGIISAVVADTPASIRQVYRGLRGKKLDKQLEKDWKQYLESGAKTEWFHVKSPEESSKDIDDMIAMAQGTFKGNMKAGKDAIAGFVSDMNGAVENGVRFATFKKARDAFIKNGMDENEAIARAATLAKNLTVNFNRKGNSGELLNGLYLFFNASVQGTANFLRGMTSPAKQRMLGAMVGFGALNAYVNQLISDEDDEGRSEYAQLAPYIKERNLVLMKNINPFYNGPSNQAYTIPLPYGYNVLHVLGVNMAEVAMGMISPQDASSRVAAAALGSFSPVGFGTSSNPVNFAVKGLTPQLGKPFVEIMLNEDFFGAPVYQENFDFGPQIPLANLSQAATPDFWKNTTKFMNELTGGDESRGGDIIDLGWVSPDALHHLFGTFIGGTGMFVERSARTAGAASDYLQGDYVEGDLSPNDIPIIRRFNIEGNDYGRKERYYDRRDDILLTDRQLDLLSGQERRDYLAENRQKLLMKRILDNTDKRIRNINRKLQRVGDAILKSPSIQRTIELEEIQKSLEDSKMRFINLFNKRYNERVGFTE